MTTTAASLITNPLFIATNTSNQPLAGGKLYTYAAGTLTPLATYTDATLTVPNTNPVILDEFGSAQVWLGPYTYKLNLTDVNNVQQANFPIDNLTSNGSAILLQTNLASTSGSGLVGFQGPLTGEAATTLAQMEQVSVSLARFMTPAQMTAWQSSPTTYDMTTIINTATLGAAGSTLTFIPGTYTVSGIINLYSNSRYEGHGAIIIQKAGTNLNPTTYGEGGGILQLRDAGIGNIEICDLQVNGNWANNPSSHYLGGILCDANLSTGYNMGNIKIRRCFVSNFGAEGIMTNGCSQVEISDNEVYQCGQDTSSTNNHGIMFGTLGTSSVSSIHVVRNKVIGNGTNITRKGITCFTFSSAIVSQFVVTDNIITGTYLPGIYIASLSSAPPNTDFVISSNVLSGCGASGGSLQLSQCQNGVVKGNAIAADPAGSAFQINVDSSNFITVSANSLNQPNLNGISFTDSITTGNSYCSVGGNVIYRPDRSNGGGSGISLVHTMNSVFQGNTAIDNGGTPYQNYGINEGATCTGNIYLDNQVIGWAAGGQAYNLAGTNSVLRRLDSGLVNNVSYITGPGSTAASGLQHQFIGTFGLLNQTWASFAGQLSANAVNNATLPAGACSLIIGSAGISANFTINGIAGGMDGQIIRLINASGYTCTLSYNSGSATAGNRFFMGGSTNTTLSIYGSVDLQYSSLLAGWIIIGIKN